MYLIKSAETEKELNKILDLQSKNHFSNIPADRLLNNGYVTVRHSFDELKEMNRVSGQIIAKYLDEVVGYALILTKEQKTLISDLIPMFNILDLTEYNGRKLSELNYYVMGQICIDKKHRGEGLFRKLYMKHKSKLASSYDFCVTEVAIRNKRSMSAHLKVGFVLLKTYKDHNDEWGILIWDWSNKDK